MVEIQTSQVMSKVKLKEANKPGEVTGRKVNAHANGKHQHFQDIYDKCNGKLPVEIFTLLFNHGIRSHFITKTITYASVAHNDSAFSMSKDDLCKFKGVLFLSGYHTLPQQQLC